MKNGFCEVDNTRYQGLADDVREVAESRGLAKAVAMLDRAVADLGSGAFSLAVLGMVNRGKSTFCNALLGRKDDALAPIGVNPVSNVVTVFQNGAPEVRVAFDNQGQEDAIITKEQIKNYTTEQANPGNRLRVTAVTVRDSFPNLPDGVVLVDTPGEGSVNEHHDLLLYKYLPSVDAAIYLVSAHSPLTESELSFIKEIQAQDVRKLFFALNRADQLDEDEMQDAIDHNLAMLAANGIPVAKIFPISAKTAFQGDYEGSGIQPLFKEVGEYLGREKFRVPRSRFMARVRPILDMLENGVTVEQSARKKTADELAAELQRLKGEETDLNARREEDLLTVKTAWNSAAQQLLSEIDEGLNEVESELVKGVQDAKVTSVPTLKAHCAAEFEVHTRQVIAAAVANFDNTIQTAVGKLPIQYAGLGVLSGAEDSRKSLVSGTQAKMKKALAFGVLSYVGGGLVGGIFSVACPPILIGLGGLAYYSLNMLNRIKRELLTGIPATMKNLREYWQAQRSKLDERREALLSDLRDQYELQIGPTVAALNAAVTAQGKIDHEHDKRLTELHGLIIAAKNVAQQIAREDAL